MKKVLVTGATGFLGKYVVEELSQHGYQVRAFGRNRKVGQSLENSLVSFFQGDLTKPEDLIQACQGTLGRFLPDKCLGDQVCFRGLSGDGYPTLGLRILT